MSETDTPDYCEFAWLIHRCRLMKQDVRVLKKGTDILLKWPDLLPATPLKTGLCQTVSKHLALRTFQSRVVPV